MSDNPGALSEQLIGRGEIGGDLFAREMTGIVSVLVNGGLPRAEAEDCVSKMWQAGFSAGAIDGARAMRAELTGRGAL